MEYEIPKIPTADEIVVMSDDEKKAAQETMEAAMLRMAESYQQWEAKRVQWQAEFDAAYAKFQDSIKPVFDSLTEAKTELQFDRKFLQGAAVARRLLTGDATWKAFQAAEVNKPQYDPMRMLVWALDNAPGDIRMKLVQLNTKAADTLLLERADEAGVPKPFEGALPIPALVVKSYTGKVLSKELADLVKPIEPMAAKLIEPVGPPMTIPTDTIRLLTQDEVKAVSPLDALLEPTETALARVAAMPAPTPVEPLEPVIDDIPF